MQVIETKRQLTEVLEPLRKTGKTIGFVPTMGALHQGHISLVEQSVSENPITVVSIFVNPTQFNNKNDLKNYPRTLENDLSMLENAGVDYVFHPSVEEMYPEPDTRTFEFGYLGNVMEASHRPGHFNGVAQIVSKLFDAVNANKAYFGDKDFQQLAIIKSLAKKLAWSTLIVPCPIVREASGLAMSSRNMLLSADERKSALIISKTLFEAKKLKDSKSVYELKQWVIDQLNSDAILKTEYFEIVDDTELKPIARWDEANEKIGCVAVQCGNIRLIDNIRF